MPDPPNAIPILFFVRDSDGEAISPFKKMLLVIGEPYDASAASAEECKEKLHMFLIKATPVIPVLGASYYQWAAENGRCGT